MYIAVDDTDSNRGNCTTFLATEIIRELTSDMDLIGNPRLVRLNPATPWKTRGNGALVMRFGHGTGIPRTIGSIGGKDVLCYDGCTGWEPDHSEVLERVRPLVERYHDPEQSDPGLLISSRKPSQSLYWLGVRTILSREDVDPEISRMGATTLEINKGRGLIGCVCGMAWRPRDRTYELLTYRPESRWGTVRVYDAETIRDVEFGYSSTFNSWDERDRKVAMVPATPCPVMYGLRGDSEDDLIRASKGIATEGIDRWVVFLTNQGTDDHIIRDPTELVPNRSYDLMGTVISPVRHNIGGHVFVDIATELGTVTCGAYEPSKEFRYVLDWMCVGDVIEVMGELREEPRTLNLEKVRVIFTADEVLKVSNPICPICSRTMKSTGKGDKYKCKKCHTKSYQPVVVRVRRQLVPGWYEPPTYTRRHLSKPLKRMGVEQPVEFVNGRSR